MGKKIQTLIFNIVKNHPKRSIILSLISTIIFIPGLFNVHFEFGPKTWFSKTDPLISKLEDFERKFGNDESIVVVVHHQDGIFSKEAITLVHKLTESMWELPEVMRVDSLTNYNWSTSIDDDISIEPFIDMEMDIELSEKYLSEKNKQALNDSTIPNFLLSKDSKTALLFGRLRPTMGQLQNNNELITSSTYALIEKYEKSYPGFKIFAVGPPPLNDTFRLISLKDIKVLLPVMLFLIIAFLYYFFRSIWGIVLPMIVIGTSNILVHGLAGYLDVAFTNISTTMPGILVAIGIADTVHVLVTYFQALNSGAKSKDAALFSLEKNFIPTFLTSTSTAIGFVSLVTATISPIADLGIFTGIGTLYAWLMTIFLILPLLSLLDLKAPKHFKTNSQNNDFSPWVKPYVQFLKKRKAPIVIFSFIFTFSFLSLAFMNTVNSDPFEFFKEDEPLKVNSQFIDKHVGGVMGPELYIDSGVKNGIKDPQFLAKVESLQIWLDSIPQVSRTISIVNTIKNLNKTLHGDKEEYFKLPSDRRSIADIIFLYNMSIPQGMGLEDLMTIDEKGLRVRVLWVINDSNTALEYMRDIEKKAESIGLNLTITGKMPLYKEMNGHIVTTFTNSMGLALILVTLMMVLIFRDLKIAAISMLPNVIPLIIGAGSLYLMGKTIDLGTAIVSSVSLGIAVDDTIHFLANYVKYIKQGDSTEIAISKVLNLTGPALFATTIILIFGFGCFLFGDFVPNIYFGLLTAITLAFALIVDLIFLPALLIKKNEGSK